MVHQNEKHRLDIRTSEQSNLRFVLCYVHFHTFGDSKMYDLVQDGGFRLCDGLGCVYRIFVGWDSRCVGKLS